MFNCNLSENGRGLVSPPHFSWKLFSWYILLTDHISLSDCLYFSRYWAICALQLFVKFDINLTFVIKSLATWPKSQDKNLNIMRTERVFVVKKGVFRHFQMAFSCQKLPLTWECVFKVTFGFTIIRLKYNNTNFKMFSTKAFVKYLTLLLSSAVCELCSLESKQRFARNFSVSLQQLPRNA